MFESKLTVLMDHVIKLNDKVSTCQKELEDSKARERKLITKLIVLEKKVCSGDTMTSDDYYIVGSSILREVRPDDISNGTVKCIKGGLISSVRKDVQDLEIVPKNIVTLIGGNDLDKEAASVETVSSEYT